MKIIDKFLNLNLLTFVNHKKNTFAKQKRLGFTNLSWDPELVTNSSLNFIMPFGEIKEDIKKLFVEVNPIFIDKKFEVQMCVFFRGSSISMHNDGHVFAAATIYLNKRWSIQDGGLLTFPLKNKTDVFLSFKPKYNRCILNYNDEIHFVSQVSSMIKEPRITIQVWIVEEKIKNAALRYF